jgi:hypothetical protein
MQRALLLQVFGGKSPTVLIAKAPLLVWPDAHSTRAQLKKKVLREARLSTVKADSFT